MKEFGYGDIVKYKIPQEDEDDAVVVYFEGTDEIYSIGKDGQGKTTYGFLVSDLTAYEEELTLVVKNLSN